MESNYSTSLQAEKIEKAITELEEGIKEMLPGRKIVDVCQDLKEVISEAKKKSLRTYNRSLARKTDIFVKSFLILLITIFSAISIINLLEFITVSFGKTFGLEERLQLFDTGVTLLLPAGLFIFYRMKDSIRPYRSEVLQDLHKLRMLSHIIDVKQLNKTPEWLDWKEKQNKRGRKLNRPEKAFYLEFCSQMQSLIGKIAVLYIRDVNDPALITAVNEIETLTTGLSRKTWQKLMLMQNN